MVSRLSEKTYNRLRRDVPPEVLAVSPVSTHPGMQGARGLSLPLNVIASIISYIDDTADIARVTRTCRLMYYMTLPQLYTKVTLRSYPELQFIDGKPAGFGSGSPFTMALNGLATSNSAALVNDFHISGTWEDAHIDEYTVGRVPDSTMLLGIALRAAIDKMVNLKSFRWELDMKPLKTIYQGLASRNALVSLDIRFPSCRDPRPIIMLPPLPSLRNLRVSNIDPVCYPDDISLLLLHSKQLRILRLQWSPRMREAAEPSINLRAYFSRCLEAQYKIPLEHFALSNFYGINTGDLKEIGDPNTLRSTALINCFGGAGGAAATIFVDDSWKNIPDGKVFQNLKAFRVSEPSESHAKIVGTFSGLEELYFVNTPSQHMKRASSSTTLVTDSPRSTATPASVSSYSSISQSPIRSSDQAGVALCAEYLHVLFTKHGHSLKKLLLSNQWALSGTQIAELVSSCPKLEQLGLGLSEDEPGAMRLVAPFLRNVTALRILSNEWLEKAMAIDSDLRDTMNWTSNDPIYWRIPLNSRMKWAGIGDRVFRIGKAVQRTDDDGRLEWRKEVWPATLDDVKHIEIWNLDCNDI
ncbi:hypothetical protein AAFC00_000069 [Neodothiora populina]|uniref:F-box domain-containing protein n=1 Tax=Neodothiora populina TaxID=2781224 RepID=A0ABR3P1N1_9PEZI